MIRRLLNRYHLYQSPRTPMAPTQYQSLVLLNVEAERNRTPLMHLVSGSHALVLPRLLWIGAVPFAMSDGGYAPLGTDAPRAVFDDDKEPAHEGHYLPMNQRMTAADARNLAIAIRKALPHVRNIYNGAVARLVPQTRWMASAGNRIHAGIPAHGWCVQFELEKHAETLCAFLERGNDVQIVPGLPAIVLEEEAEAKRIADKKAEAARLARELEEGPAARLARLNAELAAAQTANVT